MKPAKKAVPKRCKDCPPETKRQLVRGKDGKVKPRCATHDREWNRRVKRQMHAAYILRTYGITGEQYWAIYDYQGGHCYMCRWATGQRKLLSVDHDHKCCPGTKSCGKCVRGLLCSVCNKYLGYMHDNPNAFLRGAEYLVDPPARHVLTDASRNWST